MIDIWPALSVRRRRGSLCLVLLLGLAACATTSTEKPIASRDVRSLEYCALKAQAAGYAEFDVGAACRRAETAAEARAKITRIDAALDLACEKEASFGLERGPFSWRAYIRCVDDSI